MPQADPSIVLDTQDALRMTSVSDRGANGPFDRFCERLVRESTENIESALHEIFNGLFSSDVGQQQNARDLLAYLRRAATPDDCVWKALLGFNVEAHHGVPGAPHMAYMRANPILYHGKPEVLKEYCKILESLGQWPVLVDILTTQSLGMPETVVSIMSEMLQGLLQWPGAFQKLLPVVFASLDSSNENAKKAAEGIAHKVRNAVSKANAEVIEQFLKYAQNPVTPEGTSCLQKPEALCHFCLILEAVEGEQGPDARGILLKVLKIASESRDLELNVVACNLLLKSQNIDTADDLAWIAATICVDRKTPEYLNLAVRYLDRLFEDNYRRIVDRVLGAPIQHAGKMLLSEDDWHRFTARDFFRHLIKNGTSKQIELVPAEVITRLSEGFVDEGEFVGFNFFEELPDHRLPPEQLQEMRQGTARKVYDMLNGNAIERQFAAAFYRAFFTHCTPKQLELIPPDVMEKLERLALVGTPEQLQAFPEGYLAELRQRLAAAKTV